MDRKVIHIARRALLALCACALSVAAQQAHPPRTASQSQAAQDPQPQGQPHISIRWAIALTCVLIFGVAATQVFAANPFDDLAKDIGDAAKKSVSDAVNGAVNAMGTPNQAPTPGHAPSNPSPAAPLSTGQASGTQSNSDQFPTSRSGCPVRKDDPRWKTLPKGNHCGL